MHIVSAPLGDADGDVPVVEVHLSQDARAAGQARRAAGDIMTTWRLCHLVDAVVMTASELLTNAVPHERPPVHMQLERRRSQVHLGVHDGNPAEPPPVPRDVLADAESGRGIGIVHALADHVAVEQVQDDGKIVRATFTVTR